MKQDHEALKIFLTDDDIDDCDLFAEALEASGINCSLRVFNNGKQLIDYLNSPQSEIPNLLFLDLNMPLLSGLEALKKIRENQELNHLPVAIYTTTSSEEEKNKTYENGANLFITKPSDFGQLKEMLKKVIGMRGDLSLDTPKDKFVFSVGLVSILLIINTLIERVIKLF